MSRSLIGTLTREDQKGRDPCFEVIWGDVCPCVYILSFAYIYADRLYMLTDLANELYPLHIYILSYLADEL